MGWWGAVCVIALGVLAPGALLFLAIPIACMVLLGRFFGGGPVK